MTIVSLFVILHYLSLLQTHHLHILKHHAHSIFFEKLRLLEGREKSEERLQNEDLYYPEGISTSDPDAQIGADDLLQEAESQSESSDEDSETGLKCDEYYA